MSNYKKVFIICPVRLAYNEVKYELEQFTSFLEKEGFEVHLPHRDTKQNDTGINICIKNSTEIRQSDIVIVVFEKSSKGIYFDMGSAFSENKMIIGFCISDVLYENKKSFEKMLLQWEQKQLEEYYNNETIQYRPLYDSVVEAYNNYRKNFTLIKKLDINCFNY